MLSPFEQSTLMVLAVPAEPSEATNAKLTTIVEIRNLDFIVAPSPLLCATGRRIAPAA